MTRFSHGQNVVVYFNVYFLISLFFQYKGKLEVDGICEVEDVNHCTLEYRFSNYCLRLRVLY